jgi:hypothetical protein
LADTTPTSKALCPSPTILPAVLGATMIITASSACPPAAVVRPSSPTCNIALLTSHSALPAVATLISSAGRRSHRLRSIARCRVPAAAAVCPRAYVADALRCTLSVTTSPLPLPPLASLPAARCSACRSAPVCAPFTRHRRAAPSASAAHTHRPSLRPRPAPTACARPRHSATSPPPRVRVAMPVPSHIRRFPAPSSQTRLRVGTPTPPCVRPHRGRPLSRGRATPVSSRTRIAAAPSPRRRLCISMPNPRTACTPRPRTTACPHPSALSAHPRLRRLPHARPAPCPRPRVPPPRLHRHRAIGPCPASIEVAHSRVRRALSSRAHVAAAVGWMGPRPCPLHCTSSG